MVQNEFLKKAALSGFDERKHMVEPNNQDLSISTRLELLSLSRSSFYYVPAGKSKLNPESAALSGLGHGHHLHSNEKGIYVSHGYHQLTQQD